MDEELAGRPNKELAGHPNEDPELELEFELELELEDPEFELDDPVEELELDGFWARRHFKHTPLRPSSVSGAKQK